MNLYLFNDNDIAATFGIGTYINELKHALDGSAIRIHIVHLHSVRPVFEITKMDRIENWYIPEVRNHNTYEGDNKQIEQYYFNVIYLLRVHIKDTKDLVFHFNFNLCKSLAKGLKEVFECKTVTAIHFIKWELELHGNSQKYHLLKSKPKNQRTLPERFLFSTDEYEDLLYREVDR